MINVINTNNNENNKKNPTFVIFDRLQSRVFLVDVTFPHVKGLIEAKTKKLSKSQTCGMVTSTEILVVLSANGSIQQALLSI